MSQRAINEIIIHCTATQANRTVTIDEINGWHIRRGFCYIGYHYVIHQSGSIERGRDEREIGAHCAGHNTFSIGIAYVGGIDSVTGKPSDTRTEKQRRAMERLIVDICSRHDIQSIVGHNFYAPKACPCFNAMQEYFHLLPSMA